MQTPIESTVKRSGFPSRSTAEAERFASQIPAAKAGGLKTMEEHCHTCRRNTTWEELRSWNAFCNGASLHPTSLCIGWQCRTCGAQKRF